MLLNFGAKNFFCFREGIEISFELNANCPESVANRKMVSNVLCVKGANGSGKTNALKILSSLSEFCAYSHDLKPEDPTYFLPFFNKPEPSEFFIDFEIAGVKYSYELEANQESVVRETLYQTHKRKTLAFNREGNTLTQFNKDFEGLSVIPLRSNASLISTAFQFEFPGIQSIYYFFNSIVSNVGIAGLYENKPSISAISGFYAHNLDALEFVKKVIGDCDLGIEGIDIYAREEEGAEKTYEPFFLHKSGNETVALNYFSESSGTRSLFLELAKYYLALSAGGVLVLDEFDINLHPHVLPLLTDLFSDSKLNTKDAQLIFTTHNLDIMDRLGKYRTFLINKEDNESYGYRLDEIQGDMLRNDRAISPVYNSGKIGGVPRL